MPLADILFPRMYQTPDGFMAVRIQHVEFVIQTYETEFSSEIFLCERASAIKIRIWVTLIANLLLMVMQKGLKRQWSFSGLTTMVRITLMYYVYFYSLFNNPEKEWDIILSKAFDAPFEPSLFN